ncbi:unnamed protein product [Bursaphelenchus xylophilus]|uniref:(pine wood nematode) hypothetical protein n=1 Tax=Bursaphelenchus xylophilus TaxID=6326 RepID=A0A1I7S8P9_BURXY|nr:unnamed protein product [Bursaphelenchus xylophilus]CAG9089359.1 unnamed protein product [Bursaphelenchus xylophilus]
MVGCQLSLLLLLIVNVDVLQGQVVQGCVYHYSVNRNNVTKPACKQGEVCIELGVKNFTVYVEDNCDYFNPFDYMSVVSRYEGGRFYKYDKVQRKTGKRYNLPPLTWSSRHQIPSYHDPQFFAQLFTNSVEIVSMGRRLGELYGKDLHRIQTTLDSKLSLDEVKRAFVYKEYLFINPTKAVDFRVLYEQKGPFDGDINRPGLLVEHNVGLIDPKDIPNEHIDKNFLRLILKQCFKTDKYCSLDIKTESLDLQDYPVAFTNDDLVLESFWFQRNCEMLPMYRIRHKKTAPNVIFDFPNVERIVTHGQRLWWRYQNSPWQWSKFYYTRRGILPIIQPNDPFYDFVKQFTTPAPTTTPRPPPTTTTLKPVPAGPAPEFLEIEEDTVEYESDYVIEPIIANNGPAISRLPVIYYMFGYITVYLKGYIM